MSICLKLIGYIERCFMFLSSFGSYIFLNLERPVVTMYQLLYHLKPSILPTLFVYTFLMIFVTNIYYFPKQSLSVFLYHRHTLCSLRSRNYFFMWFSWKAVWRGGIILPLLLFYTKLWTHIILLSVLYFAPKCYENFNHTYIYIYI